MVRLAAGVRAWAASHHADLLLMLGLVVVGLVTQGVNMLDNPDLTSFDDEGIYVAQAWAVLRLGRLSPYAFVYDHAPGGWLLIAAWMGATGGPHAFGSAIDSGRTLMLALYLAILPLLYRIARQLGGGRPAAAAATALLAVSPLSLSFRRLVLLDNVMVFWLVLSLNLLLGRRGVPSLWRVVASGVCFALALLSKETAAVFGPALLFLLAWQHWRHGARRATAVWLTSAVVMASVYPLYAWSRGELWPEGDTWLLFFTIHGGPPHVSLLDALRWQATRDGGSLLNGQNLFWQLVRTDWMIRDQAFLLAGAAAVGVNLLRGAWSRGALAAGLLGALPLLYLARGGLVYSFYILDALPFLALNLAVLLGALLGRLPGRTAGVVAAALCVVLTGNLWRLGKLQPLYAEHPGAAERAAVTWVKGHVPAQSLMIVNDNWWADLHEPGYGGPAFPNAHSHWKVALETAVRSGIFHDDWRTVDYLLITAGTKGAMADTENAVGLEALRHAHRVNVWGTGDGAIELWQVERP